MLGMRHFILHTLYIPKHLSKFCGPQCGLRYESRRKNLRYRLSAEDFQDLQKQLDEAKALLAQCQDPQGLVKSLQESAERIRLLEKENVDLSRILTNYVSNPAMLPCRAADASIKREVLVKREVP